MMVSLTELRSNIYKYFEAVKNTGAPLEIKDKDGVFTVQYSKPKSRIEALDEGGLDLYVGDPDELDHIEWPDPSQEEINLL